jgi:WhiB family redox-sensing transcriptional regulator
MTPPITSTDWMGEALCARTDPTLFHPTKGRGDMSRQAKAICRQCPVIDECLQYALTQPGIEGVLGGTNERERRALRRRRAA